MGLNTLIPEPLLRKLHWISGGGTSFARGLNDVPKMAVLLVVAVAQGGGVRADRELVLAVILVSVAMGIGSLWKGLKILHVLSLSGSAARLLHRPDCKLAYHGAHSSGISARSSCLNHLCECGGAFRDQDPVRKGTSQSRRASKYPWGRFVTFPATVFLSALFSLTFNLFEFKGF